MSYSLKDLKERYSFLTEQAEIYQNTPMHEAFLMDADALRIEIEIRERQNELRGAK